jgi:hypothetical protein
VVGGGVRVEHPAGAVRAGERGDARVEVVDFEGGGTAVRIHGRDSVEAGGEVCEDGSGGDGNAVGVEPNQLHVPDAAGGGHLGKAGFIRDEHEFERAGETGRERSGVELDDLASAEVHVCEGRKLRGIARGPEEQVRVRGELGALGDRDAVVQGQPVVPRERSCGREFVGHARPAEGDEVVAVRQALEVREA